MKILLAHNFYQQPGGEDRCFAAEADLLRDRGHEVVCYTQDNKTIDEMSSMRLAVKTIWNNETHADIERLAREHRFDVVHFHNTFPLISPAAYYAAKSEGAAVVQTLHNYRLICPLGTMTRNHENCGLCVGKTLPWQSLVHSCYRDSRAATGVIFSMLATHNIRGTWNKMIDVYISLTDSARRAMIAGGLPGDRIVVKPNFVDPDPGYAEETDGYALFVGRLTEVKGIETLLAAWDRLPKKPQLKIVGDGPLRPMVTAAADKHPEIEFVGPVGRDRVFELMARCSFLIFPSEWNETFGLVAIEAFAKGKPVIASHIGALGEIIENRRTGLHFRPGDPQDLADRVSWAAENPQELHAFGVNARKTYLDKYTAERNYEMLMSIYRAALEPAAFGAARVLDKEVALP